MVKDSKVVLKVILAFLFKDLESNLYVLLLKVK